MSKNDTHRLAFFVLSCMIRSIAPIVVSRNSHFTPIISWLGIQRPCTPPLEIHFLRLATFFFFSSFTLTMDCIRSSKFDFFSFAFNACIIAEYQAGLSIPAFAVDTVIPAWLISRCRPDNCVKTILHILGVIGVVLATHAQTNLTFDVLTTAKENYTNATITRVTPTYVVVDFDGGIAKVALHNLSLDIQKRLGYDPAKAAQFAAAEK